MRGSVVVVRSVCGIVEKGQGRVGCWPKEGPSTELAGSPEATPTRQSQGCTRRLPKDCARSTRIKVACRRTFMASIRAVCEHPTTLSCLLPYIEPLVHIIIYNIYVSCSIMIPSLRGI